MNSEKTSLCELTDLLERSLAISDDLNLALISIKISDAYERAKEMAADIPNLKSRK